jgi:hypothetical protein
MRSAASAMVRTGDSLSDAQLCMGESFGRDNRLLRFRKTDENACHP